MKLVTFLIVLISFSASLCADNLKKCAVMDFQTKDIFDTTAEKIGSRKLDYKTVDRASLCYISFQLPDLPKDDFDMENSTLSDCSQHFNNGRIRAGAYLGKLPTHFSGNKCYYQHDWVFCVCKPTYCNSPQYWPLVLARSLLTEKVVQHDTSIAMGLKNVLGWSDKEVEVQRSGEVTHFQCFLWLADTVGQEEYDPPFYLYNYITTRHNAPPLADALTESARLRFRSHDKQPKLRQYIEEEEPFEDGTMSLSYSSGDGDEDDEEVPADVLKMSKADEMSKNGPSATIGLVATVIAVLMYFATFGATVHMLRKFCHQLKDHTHFIRQSDSVTLLRYERLYAADTIPKEFTRKKKGGKKKTVSEPPKKSE